MSHIEGKIALITGGASGLGFGYAKALLKSGLKGVTLADVDNKKGEEAVQRLTKEFGTNRAIFIWTDVSDRAQIEEAFKKTVSTFQSLDIVINNAGIINEKYLEKCIAVNFVAIAHGTVLAIEEYLPKYRSGPEGILVNMSSVAGLGASAANPIYTATKHAVLGLNRAYSNQYHYDRKKVRVLALCPGVTIATGLFDNMDEKRYSQEFVDIAKRDMEKLPKQTPDYVTDTMIHIINHGKNGSIWVVEGGQPPYEVVIPDRQNMAKK